MKIMYIQDTHQYCVFDGRKCLKINSRIFYDQIAGMLQFYFKCGPHNKYDISSFPLFRKDTRMTEIFDFETECDVAEYLQ